MLDGYLAAMIHAMPDAVACVDIDQRVIGWNKGATALFGVGEVDALGRDLAAVIGARGFVDGDHVRAARSDGVVEVVVTITAAVAASIVVFERGDSLRDPRASLPPRTLEVLDLLVQGHSEKHIADALTLSPHTVHGHVKALHKRYRVASRAELLAAVLTPRSAP